MSIPEHGQSGQGGLEGPAAHPSAHEVLLIPRLLQTRWLGWELQLHIQDLLTWQRSELGLCLGCCCRSWALPPSLGQPAWLAGPEPEKAFAFSPRFSQLIGTLQSSRLLIFLKQ